MLAKDLPSFKDMPVVEGMPHGTAWGLWDKNGQRDNCGSLNLLTPEITLSASKEIRTGKTIALNWGMENIHNPGGGREKLEHTKKDLSHLGFKAYDDVLSFNSQAGSQWDGFRHAAHQATGLCYNGLAHADIADPSHDHQIGIDHWTKRGGIVARGVLLDYVAYAARHGISYSPISGHCISVSDLELMAQEQGVKLEPADILIVRTGWVKWYNEANDEDRKVGVHSSGSVGMGATMETVEWLWNHHFAAVASDNVAFEAWPPTSSILLHDYLLALWGTPIGEMWNLEELAEVCNQENKWSFFLTSAPLNVTAGIATPPNAIAIF